MVVALVAVGTVLASAIAWMFNRLVRARNRVREAWAQIDVQLAQRADLVPRLVAAVEGYRDHEQHTLTAVIAAREEVVAASGPRRSAQADSHLEHALSQLFALAERYPDLDADTTFHDLHSRLVLLEEDIASARRYYNALVEDYRNLLQEFPTVIVATLGRFRPAEMFLAGDDARSAPSSRIPE